MPNREQIEALLRGSIDLHLHADPDRFPRRQNLLEVARDAAESGMRAIVVKNQDTLTANLAKLIEEVVPGVRIFGGLVLNRAVGGFNPYAVEVAAKFGARIIWMPSLDAAWTLERHRADPKQTPTYASRLNQGKTYSGLSIFEEGLNGTSVRPEVQEILQIIAAHDLILDTCHLSPREIIVLVRLAKRIGVKRIMCSHINAPIIGATAEEMNSFAQEGAYLAFSLTPCMPGRIGQQPADIARMIRGAGIDRAVIGTDFGREDNPPPVEGMRMSIAHLLAEGFSESDVRSICHRMFTTENR
jgi:hypothetical protein